MEFNNSILNQQPQGQVGRAGKAPMSSGAKKSKNRSKWINIISLVLLASITLLVCALLFITSTSKGAREIDLVDSSKFQAVFLEGGQVYFGKIRTINENYIKLDNIFYLRVNGEEKETKANQDVSLSRLGCELHGPQDQMTITRSQVSFWENLKDDGQVVKAINEFNKQNPNGQKCAEPGSQSSTQQAPTSPAPSQGSTAQESNTQNP